MCPGLKKEVKMKATKRIGILGGISLESTIRYYDSLLKKYYKRRKDYHYPEIVIFSLDFQRFSDYEEKGRREHYIQYIMQGIESLEKAGADFIVMAANSPHSEFIEIQRRARIPLLSIAEVTAARASRMGISKALLLGIKHTTHSPAYKEVYERHGIEVIVPSDSEQSEIEKIIFKELVLGIKREASRRRVVAIIDGYPADAVILGCTELPLLLGQEDVAQRLFDTAALHIEAALDYALGGD